MPGRPLVDLKGGGPDGPPRLDATVDVIGTRPGARGHVDGDDRRLPGALRLYRGNTWRVSSCISGDRPSWGHGEQRQLGARAEEAVPRLQATPDRAVDHLHRRGRDPYHSPRSIGFWLHLGDHRTGRRYGRSLDPRRDLGPAAMVRLVTSQQPPPDGPDRWPPVAGLPGEQASCGRAANRDRHGLGSLPR